MSRGNTTHNTRRNKMANFIESTINGKTVVIEQDRNGIDIEYHTNFIDTYVDGIPTIIIQDECGIDIGYIIK
tara:strand:+ start:496 stop:711 length:216 start_codon:yes stop_codon:yes gene_type:complete